MLTGRREWGAEGGAGSRCLMATGPWAPPGEEAAGQERRLPPPASGWFAGPGTESAVRSAWLLRSSGACGPGDVLTALTRREKLLEAKLKTKIVLSMIASQVFILTSLNGSSKLRFWKLLASPRSTTKI